MTGPGRGEDGRLARRTVPHRQVLQPHGLCHEVLRRPAQQELDHGEGGQRIGSDRGIGDPSCPSPGSLCMLHGEGKVTTVDPHPGQVLEGRGSERGVIPCLLQGSLRERLNATHVHPADGGQAEDDAGMVTAGARRRDRLFQQGRGACRVAGVEVMLGCLDTSSEEPRAVPGR